MEIKVFNEDQIKRLKTNKKHIVISIQDPSCEYVKLPNNKSREGWLRLKFYDFDQITGQKNYDKYLFQRNHAKSILNFTLWHKNEIDMICINCVAGISRSAGIAAALSKILNGDDSYFFKRYCPNMLVYSLILQTHYEK